ncbi:MAG TPA: hypothetical protein VN579_07305 [Bryobacteraceae bacterium]|nr:hypothetical protein [Bryobacteraceae bacterium]
MLRESIGFLPRVDHATFLQVMRHMIDLGGGDVEHPEPDGLTDEVMDISARNPEVMRAVQTMACEESHDFQLGALLGMAVTYNVLRTQLEVNALRSLAGSAEASVA